MEGSGNLLGEFGIDRLSLMLARIRQLGLIHTMFVMWLSSALCAQTKPPRSAKGAPVVRVPFVGCASDGQQGPLLAPREAERTVQIDTLAGRRLAYYRAETSPGVLAPRGWYCFGTYGSNGASLFVSPEPIKRDSLFSSSWDGFTGPAIQVSEVEGGTSGRFEVAQVIARVFPAKRKFVEDVIKEGLCPASDFPFGPYPNDKLFFRGDRIVEFQTPPNSKGLGTVSRLHANRDPIHGVAILHGADTNLLLLVVRLPSAMIDLTSPIIHQIEHDTSTSASAD